VRAYLVGWEPDRVSVKGVHDKYDLYDQRRRAARVMLYWSFMSYRPRKERSSAVDSYLEMTPRALET
jgi:hypothetical protein